MSDVVELEGVSIAYGETVAVRDVSLGIEEGEVHVLLGHSGSGKTTILRAIAGFERCRSGELRVADRVVDGSAFVPPEKRSIGLVFQDYALFPHMTVEANVGFGIGGGSSEDVARLLELIGLPDRADAMPGELSGGEQQRVALARALARKPVLLLLDEPFSNLDPELRSGVRQQTFELVRQTGLSTMLVTHSAEEAMEVADRISVLRRGELLQTGSPRDLYERPETVEVARALGPANVFAASVEGDRIVTPIAELPRSRVSGVPNEGEGEVVIRPEDIECGDDFSAEEVASSFLGDRLVRRFRLDGVEFVTTCRPWSSGGGGIEVRRAHWLRPG